MKKLMCLLAVVSLMMGCAHTHDAGGAEDQSQMNSGAESSYPGVTNRTLQAP